MSDAISTAAETALVPLSQGKFAVIDAEDAERVFALKWWARRSKNAARETWYAYHNDQKEGRQTTILLHRFVTDAPAGDKIDHRDGDGLNCRKDNLRRATHAQNQHNARIRSNSKNHFKGVRRPRRRTGWHARITVNGQVLTSRSCTTEEEAARAYDELARQHHGEFARLNFPNSGERSAV